MKTKPRDIGTAAETATVKILRPYWPTADRSPLRGNRDQGDIRGTGDFIWEIKAGKAAREVHREMLKTWLTQTRVEQENADAGYGILVTTRLGYGPDRADKWWAWVPVDQFAQLLGQEYIPLEFAWPVRMELGDLLMMLADLGYTDAAPWTDPTAPAELLEVTNG